MNSMYKDVMRNDARPLQPGSLFAMGFSIIHNLEFSSAFLEVHQAGLSN